MEFTYALRFMFDATNNEAEYVALIAGLRIAEQTGVKNLQANVDFRLVANQVNVTYVAKETGMIKYLEKFKNLAREKKKAGVVRRKERRYAVTNGVLYKKSFLGPWLRCVGPLQANYVLREIHEGSCSMHAGPRFGNQLDLLEEKRENVAIQEAKSKANMEKYYNARVYNTCFRLGDFFYRNNKANHAEEGGRLGPKWEGPYEVTKALGKGAYKLRDRNGSILPQTWNVCNLKKCYMHE
nr:reverse transcriptase domain-containing protein [Tanacetum cinerariifolium]